MSASVSAVLSYEIDADYDADLKARDRWADPLAMAPSSRSQAHGEKQRSDEATEERGKQRELPFNRFCSVALIFLKAPWSPL